MASGKYIIIINKMFRLEYGTRATSVADLIITDNNGELVSLMDLVKGVKLGT